MRGLNLFAQTTVASMGGALGDVAVNKAMNFLRLILVSCILLGASLLATTATAQIVYGIGSTSASGGLFNRIFLVNPTTGLATTPTVANTLPAGFTESVAIAVSPVDGLVYLTQRTAATTTPRIITWNPNTGVFSAPILAGTPANIGQILRSTFCPSGKFYVAGNGSSGGAGAEIYELNPVTFALIRTVVVTNLPTNGSGDVVCTSNGDMYAAAQNATAPNLYVLHRITEAQLAPVGNISIASVSNATSNLPNTQAFNGLSELPNGQLIGSVALNQTAVYSINPSTFLATTLTTTDFARFADLSRSFPTGLSVSKTTTPTSLIQGTQTITYSILISNPGPAVVRNVTVTDALPTAFTTIDWVCGVSSTGQTYTAVTTACQSAAGTGNINQTVSLSINGAVRYTITAVLSSTFTGTLTNVAQGTVSNLLTVVTPTATISTATATVGPAANLSVSKTNGITTTFAGNTVTYTVTFVNSGPGSADGAVIQDTASAGLSSCSVISCTPAGGATCPATPTQILAPSTTTIPVFPANSTATFLIQCGVSATGL